MAEVTLTAVSFEEQGATVSSGPRVGPNTLSEILCTGKVRVIVTDDAKPVAYSDLGEAIHTPPPLLCPQAGSSPTHRRRLVGPKTTTGPPNNSALPLGFKPWH